MKAIQHTAQLTALAAAMATALYAGNAAAVQRLIHAPVSNAAPSESNNFTMLDSTGGVVGGTNDVKMAWDGTVFTENSDYDGPICADPLPDANPSVCDNPTGATTVSNVTSSSTAPFFGHTWTAHDIQMFAPGTYTFDTAQGGGNPESGLVTVTVPPDSLGMHMLFDWNGNLNIDVFIVVNPDSVFGSGLAYTTQTNTKGEFKCDTKFTGTKVLNCLYDGAYYGTSGQPAGTQSWSLASIDPESDGVMGVPMTVGGPFAGFNANFNFRNLVSGGVAPVTLDDTVTSIGPSGTASDIAILSNDVDIDNTNGGTITTAQLQGGSAGISITSETGGTATVNGDGTVSWTNDGSTFGTNSFTYTLTDLDGKVSAAATVTIPVAAVGTAPVANPDTLAATEDTPLTIDVATDLLGNDTDAEDTTVSALASFTQPPLGKGTVVDNGDGTLTYTPPADFNGTATFTYTAIDSDTNPSNPATVTINVAAANDAPVAQNDSATTSFETAIIVSVLGNDDDADGDTLTVTAVSTPTHGAATINSGTTITYTPDAGFTGSDSFTYTISDGNGGTDTASVTVTVLAAASYVGTAVPNTPDSPELTGGSNFTMLNGSGGDVGGTNDIEASWDGSLYTDPATQTTTNMLLASALPTPFFGFTWDAHDVRVFGPGTYTFNACPGGDDSTRCTTNPQNLTMTVGPTQVGMHMLFDWGQPGAPTLCGLANCNIDVVQVVELNKTFAGATDGSDNFGAAGAVFSMASVDGNGDGIPGIPMVDGAFVGFNANFNLNLDPQFALPVVTAVASQAGNPTSVIVPTGGNVTVTATAPAGATFDWDSTLLGQQTDAALVSAVVGGTTSQTFVFDPAALADGPLTARVTIRDPNKANLANYAVVPMIVSASTSLADAADVNENGIPDGEDFGLSATQIPAEAGNGSTYLVQSSAGTLRLGQLAAEVGASTGAYAVGITATDVGVPDSGVVSSCVGGCFDFEVTGLANGATINVVLPLSAALQADAVARKFANNEWRNYSLLGGDAVASAPGGPGTCPAPGDSTYRSGLNAGDYCIQLTITDGGRNDADGTANGTIRDPIGVGSAAAAAGGGTSTISDPSLSGGGCTLSDTTNAAQRLDLWLLGTLLAWFGLRRKAQP